MTGAALTTDRLTVSVDGRRLLDATSLAIEPGTFVGVVGPNGAGKTTFLRAVAGLVRSDGRVLVDGVELPPGASRARARRIAYVPQDPVVPAGMSVEEYVLLGRTPHVRRFGVESQGDRAIAREALEALGLGALRARPIGTLSGGERQRAIVARSVAQRSPVLLLDEPTAALDLGHRHAVLELVDDLRRRLCLTVMAAIHDLTLASQYASRLLLVAGGAVVDDGSPAAVVTEANLARHWGVAASVHDDGDAIHVVTRRAGDRAHHRLVGHG